MCMCMCKKTVWTVRNRRCMRQPPRPRFAPSLVEQRPRRTQLSVWRRRAPPRLGVWHASSESPGMPHLESASAQSRLMNLWAVCSGIAQCCSRPTPPAARWCFEMCTTRRRSRWSSGWRACARGIAVTRQPCLGPLPHPPPRREPDGPRLTGPPAVRACAPAALTRSPPVLGGWGLQTPSARGGQYDFVSQASGEAGRCTPGRARTRLVVRKRGA